MQKRKGSVAKTPPVEKVEDKSTELKEGKHDDSAGVVTPEPKMSDAEDPKKEVPKQLEDAAEEPEPQAEIQPE
ncbi:unnamed protein product [Ophioblennius macclurei]